MFVSKIWIHSCMIIDCIVEGVDRFKNVRCFIQKLRKKIKWPFRVYSDFEVNLVQGKWSTKKYQKHGVCSMIINLYVAARESNPQQPSS